MGKGARTLLALLIFSLVFSFLLVTLYPTGERSVESRVGGPVRVATSHGGGPQVECPAGITAPSKWFLNKSPVVQGILLYSDVKASGGYTVTYDKRSFFVNGKRALLLSGSVHYPRSTPGLWPSLLQAMLEDGLNMVETYLFWNLHEFKRGQKYDLSGYANWTRFVELAGEAGLFVNLRIGPYACAEWNYGGLPVWLNSIPGMSVRSNNDQWKQEMSRFVKDMAALAEPYLARNGGPIIMAQIENEYGWDDPAYIDWCGDLAASLNLEVPWVMCNGRSAPNTINTCNEFDCTEYAENHAHKFPGQPLAWTENEGWFQEWGKVPGSERDLRTPEDVAYTVARWFARGGAHHNYYMWYGGTNYGRWAGSSITTMYADGANLHADALRNEPKKSHLQRLHFLLAHYSDAILVSPAQIDNHRSVLVYIATNATSGKCVRATEQYAFVYWGGGKEGGVAFVENAATSDAEVVFVGRVYRLPGQSVSVVDLASRAEIYNSGKVNTTGLPTQRRYTVLFSQLNWFAWKEDVTDLKGGFEATRPLEQLNVTQDESDYLFYQTTVSVPPRPDTLSVKGQKSQSILMFQDAVFKGSKFNAEHFYEDKRSDTIYTYQLNPPDSKPHLLTLLSVNLGNTNSFPPGWRVLRGIVGSVTLGSHDLTDGKWLHRAKLEGEILQVFTEKGSESVQWSKYGNQFAKQPLVWFQTTFPRVNVKHDQSLLLDLNGMGRGHIYLNGMDLGRYWLIENDGTVVQRYYFVPPDLLQDKNLLTLIEDMGADDPLSVRIVTSHMVVPPSGPLGKKH